MLLAIGTGSDLDDPKRFRFIGEESYVKSEKEMQAVFPEHPEVLANTQTVANLFTIVNGMPDLGAGIIPAAARAGVFDAAAQVGQNNRCPGSIERDPGDGSAPFAPANVHCDPTEVPPPGS